MTTDIYKGLTAKQMEKVKALYARAEAKRNTGLYLKFRVSRTDGSSRKGKKHHGCRYFVLDIDHDEYAKAALVAYAYSCEDKYPVLARDLLRLAFRSTTLEAP